MVPMRIRELRESLVLFNFWDGNSHVKDVRFDLTCLYEGPDVWQAGWRKAPVPRRMGEC